MLMYNYSYTWYMQKASHKCIEEVYVVSGPKKKDSETQPSIPESKNISIKSLALFICKAPVYPIDTC